MLNNERAEEEPAESFSLSRVDNFRRRGAAAPTTPAEILLVQIFLIRGGEGTHFMTYKNKRLKGRNNKTDLEGDSADSVVLSDEVKPCDSCCAATSGLLIIQRRPQRRLSGRSSPAAFPPACYSSASSFQAP